MTSTTRSLTIRSTGRRIVGALSAGAAVAVVGVGAPALGTVVYRHDGTRFVRV